MAAAARKAQPWAPSPEPPRRPLERAPSGARGAGRTAKGRGGAAAAAGAGPPARRPHRAPARPGRLPHLGHLEEVALWRLCPSWSLFAKRVEWFPEGEQRGRVRRASGGGRADARRQGFLGRRSSPGTWRFPRSLPPRAPLAPCFHPPETLQWGTPSWESLSFPGHDSRALFRVRPPQGPHLARCARALHRSALRCPPNRTRKSTGSQKRPAPVARTGRGHGDRGRLRVARGRRRRPGARGPGGGGPAPGRRGPRMGGAAYEDGARAFWRGHAAASVLLALAAAALLATDPGLRAGAGGCGPAQAPTQRCPGGCGGRGD